jgi:BirA family biotin operon repressor/biotin-[acetyl-CoA-carboxylase] ligase
MILPPPTAEWNLPTRHVGRRVLYYDELPSTLPVAAALAADPANDGTAILAGVQTTGRGQYGRSWLCPPGAGVLLGLLLFPPPPLRRPAVLTAWAAVAVTEVVRRLTGRSATIKWPNDVLIDGGKVCGILIESSAVAGRPASVVIGIGLNVNQTAAQFAVAGLPDATSLMSSSGETFDTHTVARHLLVSLDDTYTQLNGDERGAVETRWKAAIGLLDEHVVVETHDGTQHRGRLRELTFDGLVLEADAEVIRLPPEGVRQLKRRGDLFPPSKVGREH